MMAALPERFLFCALCAMLAIAAAVGLLSQVA